MTVFSQRVSASSDDAEEEDAGGNMVLTSSDLELVNDPSLSGNADVGCRFLNVTIGQGETINSATVTFTVDEATTAGTPSVRIFGEDADDATTFTTSTNDITGRTRTTASVDWNVDDFTAENDEVASPDISSIISEIVGRAGWSSGNALVVFFDHLSGTDPRTAEAYDGETASAPLLEVDYGASGLTVNGVAVSASTAVGAPSISGSGQASITGATIQAASAIQTPSISGNGQASISGVAVAASSAIQAPSVSGDGQASITGEAVQATSAIAAPTTSVQGSLQVSGQSVQVASSLATPAVRTSEQILTGATVQAASSVVTPTISASGQIATNAVAVTVTASTPNGTVSASGQAAISPDALAVLTSLGTPTVSGNGQVTISGLSVQAATGIFAPALASALSGSIQLTLQARSTSLSAQSRGTLTLGEFFPLTFPIELDGSHVVLTLDERP